MGHSEKLPDLARKTPEETAALLVARRLDELREAGEISPAPEGETQTLEQQTREQQENWLRTRVRRDSGERHL